MNKTTKNLLIELGVCELPTEAVETLSQAFLDIFAKKLTESRINFTSIKRFATARRLAIQITEIEQSQPDQEIEKRGPALKAAKDNEGNWTRPAEGFAKSCGVSPADLVEVETPKGAWLFYKGIEKGKQTIEIIPELFKQTMAELPIAKRMRWANRSDSFVRPVVSLVMLMNESIIDFELFGIKSSNQTIGHRFHGEKHIKIDNAMSYEQNLADSFVIADIEKRKDIIIEQTALLIADIESKTGANAVITDTVLNEVNALVEYPVTILGEFNPRYLKIPQEVLIKTMQDNQKYFAVVDDNDEILPYFITVSNINSTNMETVRVGNQRVIEPRFADAEFFWNNDRKKTLESNLEALKKVVYQQKLGSIYERSQRISKIAQFIANKANLGSEIITNSARASVLGKCDLVSEMVFEFGELQGVIGQYYAKNDGENDEVCNAIREQYLPKFAGDNLPKTDTGLVVSLADKIENIIGGFSVGAKPTGTKDPYALRRASLSIIRLLNETKLDLELLDILNFATTVFADDLNCAKQILDIQNYINERLKGYFSDKGINYDIFEAVNLVKPNKLSDFTNRVNALSEFVKNDNAQNLFAANKRISNILKKAENISKQVDESLFSEDAEKELFAKVNLAKTNLKSAISNNDYKTALDSLSVLRKPLDNFFESVMVMSENEAEKNNRLAMLTNIREMFLQIADVSVVG